MASEENTIPSARTTGAFNPRLEKKQEMGTIGGGLDDTQPQTGNSNKGHSILSSEGAIGRQFNPDGNIGQIGNKVGGPFHEDGVIGSQFDASKEGIAGKVERAVGGPRKET
ncbi:hypothetical protein Dda_8957 [Drechslerella dactyloides]|uniref:Uncharacterized protein n=1 Tax=Drechslerella dactyloides TaxID=74499 RepID=A0AAD6IT24_DREDA|nr:hypothetical protein Dda_8957 [Drechslerella dactyloides]